MSNTSAPAARLLAPALREEAEALLRRLAGESARLREDQWTAIHALVEERPAGAGRAADRLGQVGGVLRRHRAAAGARGRADGDRLAAAGVDAQPDRGRRAGRDPGADHQLGEPARVGGDPGRGRGRRGGRAADLPGAAEQPRLPRRGAAQAGLRGGAAGRGRGAHGQRLGPRLPAGLPPDPHVPGRPAARTSRCWPRPRRRTRGWWPTSPSSSARTAETTRWCCAGRWTARACRCTWCGWAAPRSGSRSWPSSCRTCRARGSSTP